MFSPGTTSVNDMPHIHLYECTQGLLEDMSDGPLPTTVSGWDSGVLSLASGMTHFGFVCQGRSTLRCAVGQFELTAGMYFRVGCSEAQEGESPGATSQAAVGGAGRGIVLSRHDEQGLFMLGGPIEDTGRLRYIDGCTDSLLIPPVIRGDACLNLLHIPPYTHQTQHTHPSLRAGVIVRGRGRCITPSRSVDLVPGCVFVIPADSLHSFHTEDQPLLVIAFHPDSDCGPTHEDHPMVNRTIVDGVSASQIPEIATGHAGVNPICKPLPSHVSIQGHFVSDAKAGRVSE